MELKYFVVKEEIQKQKVFIEHIRIEFMIADPLIEGLQPKAFDKHVQKMVIGFPF